MNIGILNLGLFHMTLNIYRVYKRKGIHSMSYEDNKKHAIFWDFDDSGKIEEVCQDLLFVQEKYCLPAIYLVQSSIGKFHAYCFTARTFKETIHIVSDSLLVDEWFLRLGCARGYWTLRINKRTERELKPLIILYSYYPNEQSGEVLSISDFITSNGGK